MTLPHVKTNGRVLFEFCVEKPVVMHEFCCHKGRKSFFQSFQVNYPAFSDGCCVQPSLNSKTTLSFCRIFTCKTQLDVHKNLQMHTNVTDVCGKVTSKCSCISSILQTAFVTALHEKKHGST